MDIKDKLAIITGGASGLGAAAARVLSREGAKVILFDRDTVAGEAVAAEVGGHFQHVDVASDDDVSAAFAECEQRFGPARILVNSAGIARGFDMIDEDGHPHPLSDFRDIINVNLVGTFNCMRIFAANAAKAPPLDTRERAVVINVASIAGLDGPQNQTAYGASKAGVIGMTVAAARSLARHGIRVVTIAPGLFDTPIIAAANLSSETVQEAASTMIPFPNRAGQPLEFGELVASICRLPYLNAETIRYDGGMRAGYW